MYDNTRQQIRGAVSFIFICLTYLYYFDKLYQHIWAQPTTHRGKNFQNREFYVIRSNSGRIYHAYTVCDTGSERYY